MRQFFALDLPSLPPLPLRLWTHIGRIGRLRQMRVHAQPGPVGLREPPEDVLCRLVDVRSPGVLWEELLERDLGQLGLEDVDLVEEQDHTRPQEPPRVDHRLKQDERFLHPVLRERRDGGEEAWSAESEEMMDSIEGG